MNNTFRTAWFLALRYFCRFSKWTTGLIIFVLTLTFLNLVVVSGLLVGLIEGSVLSSKELYTGEIFITPTNQNKYIKKQNELFNILKNDERIKGYSERYITNARLYKDFNDSLYKRGGETEVIVNATVTGINVKKEEKFFGLNKKITDGRWFLDGDTGVVVLGSRLTAKKDDTLFTDERVLGHVVPGDTIEIKFDGTNTKPKKFKVIGIAQTKKIEYDYGLLIPEKELRRILGYNVLFGPNNIGVRTKEGANLTDIIKTVKTLTDDSLINVRTSEESIGQYLGNIRKTFSLLGNVIGSISVIVVAVMLFIIIFISAITKKKQIGILKGIGISPLILKLSYMFLSLIYTFIGISIGLLIFYFLLKPYFEANPIDFPFSDGILFVTLYGIATKIILLFIMAIFAGFLPAHIIIKKNTLDSILER